MSDLPPGSLILLGALLVPLLRGRWGSVWTIAMPAVSFLHLLAGFSAGDTNSFTWFDLQLTPIRVDRLSLVWGYVFHIAAILAGIYSWHVRDRIMRTTAMLYVGASIGAIFAGDLLTLFTFWEVTAIASVFLVWAGKTEESTAAGFRYLLLHIASGVILLSGAILLFVDRGSLSFGDPDQVGMFHELKSWGEILLLVGIGIKAAFPLVHCWLPDAYPKSTPSGTVYLSAFTTKMAIYALARGYAGCEPLIAIGCIMVLIPLIHAILADDLRRTLAHVLHNQLGFMVVAIGVGTPMAISGASAQAFAHVIYKGLLFMCTGAVLFRTGSVLQSRPSGLARAMPWTCAFCLVGALSVLPLNCGFVTKALVSTAVGEAHLDTVWLILIIGAIGAFLTAGLKVPYFLFFARPSHEDSNKRLRLDEFNEAPTHMLWAMGTSAVICLMIGCFPNLLYTHLPHAIEHYEVYTVGHVVTQLQMLGFTTLVFFVAIRFGFVPKPLGSLRDVDWTYRVALPLIVSRLRRETTDTSPESTKRPSRFDQIWDTLVQASGEAGVLGRTVSTGGMAIAAITLLAIYLVVYYRSMVWQ